MGRTVSIARFMKKALRKPYESDIIERRGFHTNPALRTGQSTFMKEERMI